MPRTVRIRQLFTDSLVVEPILRRSSSGTLICTATAGGLSEPCPDNRCYCFRSTDNGESWTSRQPLCPETGRATICTELTVDTEGMTAYLCEHEGLFFDWTAPRYRTTDDGRSWHRIEDTPCFPEYAWIRAQIRLQSGRLLMPYQFYPSDCERHARVRRGEPNAYLHPQNVETGVLISDDNGISWRAIPACTFDVTFTEPTAVELADGRVVMLMRRDGTGVLWRTDSTDGGETWSEPTDTGIPNPPNMVKLFRLDGDRVGLVHTPSQTARHPLELWISDDGLQTWCSKTKLTDFPGDYHYPGGFYEDGHLYFCIEHNRHTLLFFDVDIAAR